MVDGEMLSYPRSPALVIEDDDAMAMVIVDALEELGYEVVREESGEGGYRAALELQFPLILLDAGLPDRDGVEVCRALRLEPVCRDTYVLMVTGCKENDHLTKALDAGVDDYLSKPFLLADLAVRLQVAERQIRERRARRDAESALIRSQQLAAVGTLAAGVAHEFNNVNSCVLGYLSLALSTEGLSQEAEEVLMLARRSVRRCSELTTRLMSFSGKGSQQREEVNLGGLVGEALSLLGGEFRNQGIEVVRELEETPNLLVDGSLMGQVILNLLINASHAVADTPEKRITLRSGVCDNRCFLSVQDTGIGIPQDRQASIFLPFFSTKGEHATGTDSQSDIKGTGLGLSVSETIVREHGGEILLKSVEGKGATFTVWLPLHDMTGVEAPSEAAQTESVAASRSCRVLVLEDDVEVAQFVELLLVRAGHSVDMVEDGAEALGMYGRTPYDLVITDLQMPLMGGLRFVERLMVLDKDARVVVITGLPTLKYREQCEALGVTQLLQKPFDSQDLLRLVVRRDG